MFQVVREIAAEQLEVAGELQRLRDGHAAFFEQQALADAARVRRREARQVVERYLADQANVRVAIGRLLEAGEPGRVARIGLAMWPVWWIRSLFTEGIEAIERALAGEQSMTDLDLAHARLVHGMLAYGRGDHEQAALSLQQAVDIYQKLGDRRGVATATVPLGVISAVQSPNGGEDMLGGAVEDFRALNDPWGLTFALFSLGGALVLHQHHADAVAPLKESVDLARSIHTEVLLSNALINLGWAYLGLQDTPAAEAVLNQALVAAVTLDNRESIARALEALAASAEARSEAARGAMLFGAAESVRRSIGAAVWMTDRTSHDRTRDALRAHLGEPDYLAALQHGATLTVAELLDAAGAGNESLPPPGHRNSTGSDRRNHS
jgi:tetratricopeptide (TPR) repeat protein